MNLPLRGCPRRGLKGDKMKNSMKVLLLSSFMFALLAVFTGCTGEKEESKSMAQIYREEGVPVRISLVIPRTFATRLSYHSYLTGFRESTAYAAMDGKIERIFVKVGDPVKKDQVLLTFPTDSPSAKYFQAKVAYENARTSFERIEKLYKSGGISLQERDNAKAGFDVAKADWVTMKQLIKVKAPISGHVTRVHVSETDNVKKEMPLVTIARTDRLKAAIWVSEDEIGDIREGIAASASWQGEEVVGKVVQVDMAMNMKTRAFRALVEFDNPENVMKAGTTVEINITTSVKSGTIVLKRKNITEEKDSGKSYVYVVKNEKAEKRYVTIGKQQGLDVEILSGLNPGDRLVTEGQLLLENGAKVNVIKTKES